MNYLKLINQSSIDLEEFENLKYYIKTGELLTPPKHIHFYKIAQILEVSQNSIRFEDKIIVPEEYIEQVMDEIYKDPRTSFNSRDRFYEQITNKYLGISKRKAFNWLRKQEPYQIHQPLQKNRKLKPILTGKINTRVQIDLIDLKNLAGYNNQMKYMLTMIDCFSKLAFAYPIHNKEADSVVEALKFHFDENDNEMPKIIQMDNGPEFEGSVKEYLKKNNIKIIHSLAYKPHSQGQIERFNGTFKTLLFHYMSMLDTKRYLDILPDVLEKYNRVKHSAHGYTPLEVHSNPELTADVKQKLSQLSKKYFPTKPLENLKLGAQVRTSYQSETEGRKGELFRKSYIFKWSKEIFQVVSIGKNKEFPLFKLAFEGKIIDKYFQRHELLHVPVVLGRIQRKAPVQRKKKDYILPEQTLLQERTENDPLEIVGKRIEVFWSEEDYWLDGTVISYNARKKKYIIRYDKFVEEEIEDPDVLEDLNVEEWRLLD